MRFFHFKRFTIFSRSDVKLSSPFMSSLRSFGQLVTWSLMLLLYRSLSSACMEFSLKSNVRSWWIRFMKSNGICWQYAREKFLYCFWSRHKTLNCWRLLAMYRWIWKLFPRYDILGFRCYTNWIYLYCRHTTFVTVVSCFCWIVIRHILESNFICFVFVLRITKKDVLIDGAAIRY